VTIKTFEARLHTVGGQSGVLIIDLCGEINAFAKSELNAAYAQADSANPAAILLNFGCADFINSSGIALIVSLLTQARKSGRRVLVFGLNEHYAEIFTITRLVDFVSVYPDEASAVSAGLAPA